MFSTVVGMANSLLAQLGDPNSATNIGSLVPFFVMVFLAKGFVAATPLIVRGISGNLMVAAAPAVVSGSAGIMRGIFNTDGVKGRARIGALHDRRSDRTRGRFRLQPPCGAPRQRRARRWYGWPRGRSGWVRDQGDNADGIEMNSEGNT